MSSSCCCCVTVHETDYGILERVGKFVRVLSPGCSCIFWPFDSVAGVVSTRIQQMLLDDSAKTEDNLFVSLRIAIKFSIPTDGVKNAFYSMKDPEAQIKSHVENVNRTEISRIKYNQLFAEKSVIADAIKQELHSHLGKQGYEILDVQFLDIMLPKELVQNMNRKSEAERLRDVELYEAETKRMVALKKAEADASVSIKQAEAEAEIRRLHGEGIAAQRRAILKGLEDGVGALATATHISPERTMEYTLTTQYFDMMKDIGTSNNNATIFVPHSPGAVNDISSQLRQGMLEVKAVKMEK